MTVVLVVTIVATLCGPALVQGQGYARGSNRYTPARPTISPYFDLLRRDTGGLPSYMLYRRDQQLWSNIQRQQNTIRDQQQAIRYLNRGLLMEAQVLEDPATGMRPLLRPSAEAARPARAATFMDYAGFYQTQQPVRPTRAAR